MSKLRVEKIAAPIIKDEFTGSVYFDGTGDNLTVPASTDFAWGTADFTVEMWVYSTASDHTSGNHYMFDLGSGNLGAINYHQNKFNYYNTTVGSTRQIGGFPAFEWHHIAVARENGTTRMFLDGVVGMSFADTHNYGTSALAVEIAGYAGGSTLNWQGYISNLRVCKGHAVYTENFTVPTRELVVHKAAPRGVVFSAADNVTTLLACQSATDATLDSSGRHTITANGNAHAQSANPGLLRRTNISSTTTENTGAVFFDGTGDYLDIKENGNDFDFPEETTIESWIYFETIPTNSWVDFLGTSNNSAYLGSGKSGWIAAYYTLTVTGLQFRLSYQSNSAWIFELGWNFTATAGQWYHVVYTRESGTIYCYVNGVKLARSTTSGTGSQSDAITSSEGILRVGGGAGSTAKLLTGYISNVRICKGHAVYKSANGNFAVPTRELEVHQGPEDDRTTLLCCHDGENIFADKSGRHIIAAYGDRLSSPTPTATDSPIGITTHNPGLTRNVDPTAGPTFQGGVGYTSQNWLTLPKGTTTDRNRTGGRGLIVGGSNSNAIEFITIATLGNAQDYGDLTAETSYVGALASSTRGVYSRSRTPSSPNGDNTLEHSTLASTGNSVDFGNRTVAVYEVGALSNNTRGIIGGGYGSSNSDVMDYVTIATLGDAIDFGNLTQARRGLNGLASPTRGCFAAGYQQPDTTTETNIIDYVTIASTGNALDFGDLIGAVWGPASLASPTRGIWAGGIDPNATNVINSITISTLGNAQDFGDLSVAKGRNVGMSNSSRGVIGLEGLNTMDYITIASTGDAQDFGDMMRTISGVRGGCSDSHGGIG